MHFCRHSQLLTLNTLQMSCDQVGVTWQCHIAIAYRTITALGCQCTLARHTHCLHPKYSPYKLHKRFYRGIFNPHRNPLPVTLQVLNCIMRSVDSFVPPVLHDLQCSVYNIMSREGVGGYLGSLVHLFPVIRWPFSPQPRLRMMKIRGWHRY